MSSAKAATDFETLIETHEVVTSGELRRRLCERGLKDENARKIIERKFSKSSDFWRSEAIVLPGGQRLLAHRGFYGRREFHARVGEILKESRPGLARCLDHLSGYGVLNRVQAAKLLASPVQDRSNVRFPAYDEEVQALKELGVKVCQEKTAFEYLLGSGWQQGSHTDERAAESVTALRKESLLARILTERFRRQNVISWGGVELPSRDRIVVTFNNQYFTAYGFCHLAPVLRQERESGKAKSIPCPVLFDVHAGHCSESHVRSFLARAERATCRGKSRQSWMGVIAAREFEQPAWKLARASGLMTVNFRQMFGDEALEAMARVEELLEAFQHDLPPEKSDPAFVSFSKSLEELRANPVVVDLRSVGFEILAGKTLSEMGYHHVTLGQNVPFPPTTRDVDVYGEQGDNLFIVECKAYHKSKLVTADEVKKFYTETVPAFLKWWRNHFGVSFMVKKCRAEIWTTGRIGSEAARQLERTKLQSFVCPMLCNYESIHAYLPHRIKERCTVMLNSIAMSDEAVASEEGSEVIEAKSDV